MSEMDSNVGMGLGLGLFFMLTFIGLGVMSYLVSKALE